MTEKFINNTRVLITGEGFPLVFIHGFTTTAEFWKEQVDKFSRHFQIIRIELRGHGKNIADENEIFSIQRYAHDVVSVINQLGLEKLVLVGLSMGGSIAQAVALSNIQDRITGLVLVGATAHGLGDAVVAENVLSAIDSKGVERASQDVIEASFSRHTTRDVIEWAKQEVIQTPEFVARQAILSLNETDHTDQLQKITMPALIMVGREDDITPVAESEKLAKAIPGAKLHIIDEAAHFPMLEQPEIFNTILMDFAHNIN